MSSARTYLLKLSRSVKASVQLTGMTIDFDCRVGVADCSNHGETRDDSWSGSLAAGAHAVTVYPYARGPGNYSLAVTATRTLHRVVQPFGEVEIKLCDDDEDGSDGSCIKIHDSIDVTAPPPRLSPPPPTGLPPRWPHPSPQPPPPTGPPPTGPPTGTGGTPTERPSGSSLAAATSDISCKGWNIDAGDGFDALRPNSDGTTRKHGALDIQVSSKDAAFFALAAGVITNYAHSERCGYQVAVTLPSGGRHVYCHMAEGDRLDAGTTVRAGQRIGSYGPSGKTEGPHLHLKVTDSNDRPIDPVKAAGGKSVLAAAGFTFNSSDDEHCARE